MSASLSPERESAATSSAPANELPIDAEIGALFGDFTGADDVGDAPDASAPDAGAPPADGASATEPASGTEGTTAAPTAGAPPADATATAPDGTDPVASAKDATYTVDGQTRTFEGLKLLGEDGAIIEASHLPKLLQRLSERDHLYEQSQRAYQDRQAWERQKAEYEKAMEWRTRDGQGQERVLSGRDGLEAQRATLASSLAALQTLSAVFKANPLEYITQDAQGNIVWNPQAVETLTLRSTLAEQNAAAHARAQLASVVQQVQQAAESQAPDLAPMWQQVDSVWLKDFPQLTADDKALLQQQVGRYIRPATADEVAQGSMRHVIDHAFYALIQHHGKLRSEGAQQASAAARAAQENERRLAAAAAGTRPATPAPTTPTPTPRTQRRREQEDNQRRVWNMWENAASGR